MGSVILGKLVLKWCPSCNLPALGKVCDNCSTHTHQVKHTPPGDVRPAFPSDLNKMRSLVDVQFGDGCGERLIPTGNVVILNGIPDQDRMDEVIVSGLVVGNYRYSIEHGYRFLLKPEGAQRVLPAITRSWVRVDDDALPFVKKGRSVLAPGISDADSVIEPGNEVVVLSENGELVGTGTSRMSGTDLKETTYGLGVRLRQKWRKITLPDTYDTEGTWDDAVTASRRVLENYEAAGTNFVKKVIYQHEHLPMMVSLSGGKDSLVVLLLVMEAGFKPTLLFLNTGLEFPETVENVERTAAEFELPLVVADAGTAFWDHVSKFGPPAKDFRWCCKVCKLGPTARTIMETYPDGVLSFIGQRAYESTQRARKPRVWENPWVPGQIGASPIQQWTALHIWLYLFWKRAEYNPLYKLGFARVGCWLCPASDQADYLEILEVHPEGGRWQDFLEGYANQHGFTDDWLRYGLWKWKRPPGFVKDLMDRKGLSFRKSKEELEGGDVNGTGDGDGGQGDEVSESGTNYDEFGEEEIIPEKLTFFMGDIRPSCTDDLITEGVFNRPLDIGRIARLLSIFGLSVHDEQSGVVGIGRTLTVTWEGSMTVNGPNKKQIQKDLATILEIIIRSEECVGCGICVSRCKHEALFLDDHGRVDLEQGSCVHCRECLGKCPVTDFRDDGDFDN